jgi:DNA-binding NarL/FixJ family response regulator
MHKEEEMINKSIAAGAAGYVLKSADTKELFKAISNVLFEKVNFYSKEIKSIINQKTNEKEKTKKKSKEPPPPLNINEVLSPKEIIILNLITKELTSDEIGQILFISRRTVEGHRTRIMEKLKIKTMIGLVKIAMRNNLGN